MSKLNTDQALAELLLPSNDLTADMEFFENLGFKLNQIFPSDNPQVARMSGYGMHIRLDRNAEVHAPLIHLLSDGNKDTELIAPNGTIVRYRPAAYHLEIPEPLHQFEVRRLKDNAPWLIGRAGMLYRDLVPNRLGGSIIASHIRIPEAGPVPDVVHYHTIGFQLIYCYKGWVKLVYEDQGPPFILNAGDCVIQPPEIRHRVLEASENLEVIEIGVPSDHMTTVDHELKLPTEYFRPERLFGGQRFCRHQLENATWQQEEGNLLEFRDTGILEATAGVADVRVLRALNHGDSSPRVHKANIHFSFVLEGALELEVAEHGSQTLQSGDAFVIPPGLGFAFNKISSDLEVLAVEVN